MRAAAGNPGYSRAVLAVLNLSEAIEQPGIIYGNAPLLSVHGTADGSRRLNPRATAVGIRNTLVRLSRAGHIPFESNAAYADTTLRAIRDFLRPRLGQAGTVLAAKAGSAPPAAPARAYPNPANDQLRLQLPGAWPLPIQVQLRDATGHLVRSFSPASRELAGLKLQPARRPLSADGSRPAAGAG